MVANFTYYAVERMIVREIYECKRETSFIRLGVQGRFLLRILRALDLAKSQKDLGYRRFRRELSMWLNSSF